jgi:transposase-like protein
MSSPRLSPETKTAIVEAYKAGERLSSIAARFGVDQSYPGLLARRRRVVVGDRRSNTSRILDTDMVAA